MLAMLILVVCCVAWLRETPGGTVESKLNRSAVVVKQGMKETAQLGNRFISPVKP
jgi:hypothetical protein